MKPAVSIIVPMYNVEKYLKRALDSILKQTLKDIEIILINDGSPDKCGEIADSYSKLDNRIKVIHQKNSGAAKARNIGLEAANGKFIGFLDPDDWVEEDMYEKLYTAAEDDNADLVICSFFTEYEETGSNGISHYQYEARHFRTAKDVRENIVKQLIIKGQGAAVIWNSLYRRDIILNNCIHFENIRIFEDYVFNMRFLAHVQSARYINVPLYHYRLQSQSVSRTFKEDMFEILLKVHEHKERFMKKVEICDTQSQLEDTKWFLRTTRTCILLEFMLSKSDSIFKKYKRIRSTVKNEKSLRMANDMIKSGESNLFALLITKSAVPLITTVAMAIGSIYRIKKFLSNVQKKYLYIRKTDMK